MALPIRNFYLAEWLSYFGKRQAGVARDLDWNKAKVSLLCSGKQEFSRDDLFALADYLNIHAYELLMQPEDAMSLRRIVADAKRIAGEHNLAPVTKLDILKKPSKANGHPGRGTGTDG